MRTALWNNLGVEVEGAARMDEVLAQAGLDYEVRKEPILTESGVVIPNRFANVREDGHVYGVVSDRYSIVQNQDAFNFIDYISDDIEFVKAGETQAGIVWVIARLPGWMEVMGDEFVPYVIFQNSFAGNSQIAAAIVPLRVVCQNQFNFAFAEAENTVRILHVGDVDSKMKEANEILRAQASAMENIRAEADRWIKIKVRKRDIVAAMDRMFPIQEGGNAFAVHRAEELRGRFQEAYDHDDNSNFRGTAWGMINAYSDFVTHNPVMGKTDTREENKFIKAVFSPMKFKHLLGDLAA